MSENWDKGLPSMENVERQMENMEMGERRMSIDWGKGLPPLIAKIIFSKLVISNLPSCRFVCKTWNHLVLHYASSTQLQFLTNAFLLSTSDQMLNYELCNPKMHSINLDNTQCSDDVDLEMEFIKSGSFQFYGDWTFMILMAHPCNGLVFISKCSDYTWCQGIFNPMTNEFFQVSEQDTFDDFYNYGFGLSPVTKQYKLFRTSKAIPYSKRFRLVSTCSTDDTHYMMEVLTFGRSGTNHIPIHNQWRHLHNLSYDIVVGDGGVYLNGIIFGWEKKNVKRKRKYDIYALDDETEQTEMSVILQVHARDGKMHLFNGTIYATFYTNWEKDDLTVQVWSMQEKHSWIRKFVISDISKQWSCLELIKMFKDGDISDFFYFYNPLTKKKSIISKDQKKKSCVCQIECLNFGSLPKIFDGTNL